METVFLKKGEDRRLRAGHLWVFSNEIDVKRSPLVSFTPGESVLVADCGGRILGTGYVNPASLIAVRMISRRAEETLDADLLRRRLSDALALRERMFQRPFYRLCHGEGDFLPGLVADRHGDHVVCQITTAGMDVHTEELVSVLDELLHPASILLDNDVASRDLEGLERFQRSALGEAPEELQIEENGLTYVLPLKGGQKTGWFYDQRVNRAALAPFVQSLPGCHVLDAFCYAGGFGALADLGGRSGQISPTRSQSVQRRAPSTAPASSCARAALTTRPSKPSVPPPGSAPRRYSASVGTPGSPIFISRKPLPAISRAAWMK